MSIHVWVCADCSKSTEVIRGRDDWDAPPTVEEGGACNCDERAGAQLHTWQKRMQPFKIVKGPNWGPGGKGAW